MKNKKVLLWVALIIIAIALAVYSYLRYFGIDEKEAPPMIEFKVDVEQIQKEQAQTTSEEVKPKKTEYENSIPSELPLDIPVEKDAINQSYNLDYVGSNQFTVVFVSQKTVSQNYDIYEKFLQQGNWEISNKYESDSVSSLYARKDNGEINITLTQAEPNKSQISISFLKK